MATIVCQGLQSCLESQVVESRTLRLILCSPKPQITFTSTSLDSNTKQVEEKCHSQENSKKSDSIFTTADSGCWSSLQSISNGSQLGSSKENIDKENTTYVHPQVKSSMSSLSEKSLKLCTESLGSETGTDIIEDNIFSLSSSTPCSSGENYSNSPTREQQKPRQLLGAKTASSRSFPPPLTTISGLESLQVRPHREDGRLIIKATKAPSTRSIFQAERSHGRLRLSFYAPFYDSEECYQEEGIENEYVDEEKDNEEVEGRESDLKEHEDEEENDAYLEEDMNWNSLDAGVKMGMEKFKRPGRCKDGEPENNKGLLNWEPTVWVATS